MGVWGAKGRWQVDHSKSDSKQQRGPVASNDGAYLVQPGTSAIPNVPPGCSPATVRRGLSLLTLGQPFEVRAISADRSVVRKAFPGDGLDEPCSFISAHGEANVYYTLNPTRQAMARSARDEDIARRRWLLVDVDSGQPADTNATDEEADASWHVARDVMTGLEKEFGWPDPVVICSGNGWHLIYRIDLPNDADTTENIRSALCYLAYRFNSGTVKIDTTVFNASRIARLPGTVNRKGPHTDYRPQRRAFFVEVPGQLVAVSRQQLAGLAARWQAVSPDASASSTAAPLPGSILRGRATGGGGATARERCIAYVAKRPAAVSGQRGHDATWDVSQDIFRGFALAWEEGWPILVAYNDRCQPPWSEKELRHKAEDAIANSKLPLGYLLNQGSDLAGPIRVAGLATVASACGAAERYQPFPLDTLPADLARFVAQAAAIGCDPSFIALPALAVAASAIGNTRIIRLKRGWEEPSVLWSVPVGDSGTLKSPGYRVAVAPLFTEQGRRMERHLRQQREYKAAKEGGDAGDPPTLERVICSDTTIEKLADLLHDNERGLLLARDELAGWFGSFSRYKGKGGGSDVPLWLEASNGGPWVIDRKTGDRKTTIVKRAAVSVTGSIQPGVLAIALSAESREAGLAARLLMAMPPRKAKKWSDDVIAEETQERYHDLVAKLLGLSFGRASDGGLIPYALQLSAEAKADWETWYNAWAKEQDAAEGELLAAYSKLEGYAARLALVHHVVTCVSAGEDDRQPVRPESIHAGIALVRWFAAEARRIYAVLSESHEERDCRRMVELIRAKGGRITTKELQRSNSRKYRSSEEAKAALDALAAAGLGEWQERPTTGRGGRPTFDFILRTTHDAADETPSAEPARPPGASDDSADGPDQVVFS